MEYIPRQVSNSDVKDTTLDHTAVAESFIHLATAAPTTANDEGTGYAVGCIWVDYSNGETYTCIDSTDEGAKWAAQDGSDDVNIFKIQGSTYGYHYAWADAGAYPDVNDRFALTSSGNATDIGERAHGNYCNRGSTRTTTHNYFVGFENGPASPKSSIYRFPFSAPSSTTDIGEHSLEPSYSPSLGSTGGACDGTTGFISGGSVQPPAVDIDHIEKFTMVSPAPSSDTGAELTAARFGQSGASDIVGGKMFVAAGYHPPVGTLNLIEQAAFTISSGTTSDWGDTVVSGAWTGGNQSTTHGYVQGGYPSTDQIGKYSFSSPGNATDVGNLSAPVNNSAGCSSTTHGYRIGGETPSALTNIIENYPYSSDTNASDVGDLTSVAQGGSGAEI